MIQRWAFDVVRVAGIRIRIHATFFVLLAWVGWLGFEIAGVFGLLWALAIIIAVFTCVVLHELGHCLTALRLGVPVDTITLLPVGGVAHMSRIPERPFHEFLIAIAGPLVNVVIALVIMAFRGWPDFASEESLPTSIGSFFDQILQANLFLVVFNMLPAFPMDGGRILRSALAAVLPYPSATRIAAGVGRTLALGFMAAGFLLNPFLVLIGLVVFWGAGAEARMVETRHRLRETTVAQAIQPPRAIVRVDQTIGDCLRLCHATGETDFAVMDGNQMAGWLPEELWRTVAAQGYTDRPVVEVMDRRFVAIRPEASADAALDHANRLRRKTIPVMQGGAFLGVLRLGDATDAPRRATPARRRSGWELDLG